MGGDGGQIANPAQCYLRAVSAAYHPTAWELAQFLKNHGVETWISSPGSRHAPLIEAFYGLGFPHHHVVLDERSAAHFALGAAEASGKPVVVLCTSGSAAQNLAPALIEAFYREIPLIALTADRPSAQIDQGQGQSIRQNNLFGDHVVASFSLEEDCVDESTEACQARTARNRQRWTLAWEAAVRDKGPVHLNVPLREPLYGYAPDAGVFAKNGGSLADRAERTAVLPEVEMAHAPGRPRNNNPVFTDFSHDTAGWDAPWWSAERRALWVGQMTAEQGAAWRPVLLRWLDADPRLVVVAEPLSNLGPGPWMGWEQHLAFSCAVSDVPQAVFTLGGATVAKRVKNAWAAQPPWQVHVGTNVRIPSIWGTLQAHLAVDAPSFLALLNLRYSAESVGSISNGEAPTAWRPAVEAAQERLVQRLQSTEAAHGDACLAANCLTDGVAVSLLLDHLPAGMRLSVGNSAAIRHALRSASIRPQSWDRVWQGNRGTSGIDGSSSTALGAAWSDGMPTCLLTGELSFFYDATAWFQESLPPAFVAVVLNNAGGGIFRLIDGPSSTGHLARDFEVRHQRSVLPWAREMGCTVFSVKTHQDWLNILRSDAFLHPKAPCVIEVCTDPDLTENQWKNPIL